MDGSDNRQTTTDYSVAIPDVCCFRKFEAALNRFVFGVRVRSARTKSVQSVAQVRAQVTVIRSRGQQPR